MMLPAGGTKMVMVKVPLTVAPAMSRTVNWMLLIRAGGGRDAREGDVRPG